MVFSSVTFLFLFLPIVLAGYFLLKIEYRNVFLLFASLLFYAAGEPKFVIVMIASIVINYIMGLIIDYSNRSKGVLYCKLTLALAVILNLGILFYFKYLGFFTGMLNGILGKNFEISNIVLPIGISFFTFQGMSYILDLYFGTVKVQKKFVNLALYIALFPQLIAGPIVRYHDINNQIEERNVTLEKFEHGVRRFIVGLAKKVIIANQLGFVADQIFANNPVENYLVTAWVGAICYSFQLYFDFSGYSDMAIGLGKMFGFDFLENFNYPYISKSVTEFWRRWHMSLSTWFRDYLYIPLGGNRRGNTYLNLFIVFLATGLWHGAAWNFILWGLWHGFFLILEKLLKKKHTGSKLPEFLGWSYTMLIVIFGWVLFRSPDLNFAMEYISVMIGIKEPQNVGYTVFWYLNNKIIFIIIVAIFASYPYKVKFKDSIAKISGTYIEVFSTKFALLVLLFISIMLVMTSTYNPFIYFRF